MTNDTGGPVTGVLTRIFKEYGLCTCLLAPVIPFMVATAFVVGLAVYITSLYELQ